MSGRWFVRWGSIGGLSEGTLPCWLSSSPIEEKASVKFFSLVSEKWLLINEFYGLVFPCKIDLSFCPFICCCNFVAWLICMTYLDLDDIRIRYHC